MSIWTNRKVLDKYENLRQKVTKDPKFKTIFIVEKAYSLGEVSTEEREDYLKSLYKPK